MKIPAFQVITGLDELVAVFGNQDKLGAFLKQQQDFARQINERIGQLSELGDLETQRSQARAMASEARSQTVAVEALADEHRRQQQEAATRLATAHAALEARSRDLDGRASALEQREQALAASVAEVQRREQAAEGAQRRAQDAAAAAREREAEFRRRLDELKAATLAAERS